MSILDDILGIVAPHSCMFCGSEGNIICRSCGLSLPSLPSVCYACGKATRVFKPCIKHVGVKKPRRVFIHSEYKGEVKQALHMYKFQYKRSAARDLAALMHSILPYYANAPLICFVPTIGKNIRERGFDHTKLIAKELARMRGWNYAPLLYKTKNIRQIGATRFERKKQIRGVIRVVNEPLVKNANILLVDDVITTGATVEACSEELYKAGATDVDVVVLARTP